MKKLAILLFKVGGVLFMAGALVCLAGFSYAVFLVMQSPVTDVAVAQFTRIGAAAALAGFTVLFFGSIIYSVAVCPEG